MAAFKEISQEVFPYLRQYTDGTIERLVGTAITPAGLDSETNVLSKDAVISAKTNLSARIYLPDSINKNPNQKLPLLVYFHGGAFCIASPAEPMYHSCMNRLVAKANVIAVSVDYRLAPEHPLPTAYDDSWAALQWVAAHGANGSEGHADIDRVFLAGDSAGANIVHHMAMRAKKSDLGIKIRGIVLIHPYFWGKDPIGVEKRESERKSMVDNWWMFVCPSDKGCDDPYINPFADGAPSVEWLGCDRVLVFVAEKDILRDRGKIYYERLMKIGWGGKAEIVETKGEDHVFHIFNPDCENARLMIKKWASFVNQERII